MSTQSSFRESILTSPTNLLRKIYMPYLGKTSSVPSLPPWQKAMYVEVIVIFEFMDSETRITSTFKVFARLKGFNFEKPLMFW